MLKFILHLKIWFWAAMHSQDFQYFTISITPFLVIYPLKGVHSGLDLYLKIRKPGLFYRIPLEAVADFKNSLLPTGNEFLDEFLDEKIENLIPF
jgi:hypothetical protein